MNGTSGDLKHEWQIKMKKEEWIKVEIEKVDWESLEGVLNTFDDVWDRLMTEIAQGHFYLPNLNEMLVASEAMHTSIHETLLGD